MDATTQISLKLFAISFLLFDGLKPKLGIGYGYSTSHDAAVLELRLHLEDEYPKSAGWILSEIAVKEIPNETDEWMIIWKERDHG